MVAYILIALLLGALAFVFIPLCDQDYIKEKVILAFVCTVVGFLFWGAFHWFFLPNLALDNFSLYFEAVITLMVYGWVFTAFDDGNNMGKKLIPATLVLLIFVGVWLYSWDLFHYEDKYKMLQVEETTDLVENSISPIPVEKMTIMNTEVARALIGQKMNDLGNRCYIGKFTKQSFTGKFKAKDIMVSLIALLFVLKFIFVYM